MSGSARSRTVPIGFEVLTNREVAALLNLPQKTFYTMAHASGLPAFHHRKQKRIKRFEFDQSLVAQPRSSDKGRHDDK